MGGRRRCSHVARSPPTVGARERRPSLPPTQCESARWSVRSRQDPPQSIAGSRELASHGPIADAERVRDLGDRHVVPVGQIGDRPLLDTQLIERREDIFRCIFGDSSRRSSARYDEMFTKDTAPVAPMVHPSPICHCTEQERLRVARPRPRAIGVAQQIDERVGHDIGSPGWRHQQRRVSDEIIGVPSVRVFDRDLVHTSTLPPPTKAGDNTVRKLAGIDRARFRTRAAPVVHMCKGVWVVLDARSGRGAGALTWVDSRGGPRGSV